MRSLKYIWQLFLGVYVGATSESFFVSRADSAQLLWYLKPCWNCIRGIAVLLQMLLQVRRQGYHLVQLCGIYILYLLPKRRQILTRRLLLLQDLDALLSQILWYLGCSIVMCLIHLHPPLLASQSRTRCSCCSVRDTVIMPFWNTVHLLTDVIIFAFVCDLLAIFYPDSRLVVPFRLWDSIWTCVRYIIAFLGLMSCGIEYLILLVSDGSGGIWVSTSSLIGSYLFIKYGDCFISLVVMASVSVCLAIRLRALIG